ncbi:MAG: XTP/dITP diphosphatase [SAR202 cluster bacterium]|nr:XTP/dITP diphosphatase [SAR202 cluster bacterium]
MKNLLIATTNKGKVKELTEMLTGYPVKVLSLADVGITTDVEETGETFEENAVLKARAYADLSGLATLADDSGLEVEALGGEPGVRSARYAGVGASDDRKIAFLLEKLKNVKAGARRARFRSVIAVCWDDDRLDIFEGECHGEIAFEPRGSNGFGYDPIFLFPELGKTMAELPPKEKNRRSHRGAAFRKAATALKRWAGA